MTGRNLKIPSLLPTGVISKPPERDENLFCLSRLLEKQSGSKLFSSVFLPTWPHTTATLVHVSYDLNYRTCHKGLWCTAAYNTIFFYPLNTKDVTFIQANLIYQCHIKIPSVFISIVSSLAIK